MRPPQRSLTATALVALALASCADSNVANPNTPVDAARDAPNDAAPNDLPSDQGAPLDVANDAPNDLGADVAADVPQDLGADVLADVASDPGPDVAEDVTRDAGTDAAGDVGADATPDAPPPRCTSDAQCAGNPAGSVCETTTGRCVACTPSRDVCPSGQRCVEGMNACATGCRDDAACGTDGGAALRCDPVSHACVRCLTDAHCGAGQHCAGSTCVEGCVTAANCAAGQSCCGAMCVDTGTNTGHCGGCGAVCAPANGSGVCAGGVCGVGACGAPYADCNAMPGDGCEVDTRTDARHCGRCGAPATLPHATAACVMGAAAVRTCDAGYGDCDGMSANGCETATLANNAACGGCGVACGAGQLCDAGACVTDCRRSGAAACGAGTACDYTDGVCRAAGTRCALAGEFVTCGTQSCGPGSVCDPRTLTCAASLSCRGVFCEAGTARCWGNDCPCDRPAAACTTLAPSAVPSGFLSGAFGFDIDDACNLYTATMLSGPDYVRRVDTAGRVTIYTSVANLNMGEVAVQRRINVGVGGAAANVAFTYICCAACGCASTPPQGVGHVQSDGTLPVVVPATVTSGTGPFGVNYLDTGPYGLSVSSLGEFFVGNVRANGDFYRYDTDTRTITSVATLPARITATTSFDLDTMLVALQGGALYLVDRSPGGTSRMLGTLGADVQSVRRDPFTGRFYASLRGGRIVSFLPDATGITMESMAARGSRVAVSPDGWLYILLEEGGPISRIALPSSR